MINYFYKKDKLSFKRIFWTMADAESKAVTEP